MSDIGKTGDIGYGTFITFDGDNYYVASLKPPGFSVDAVDTTNTGSPNYRKESIPGLVDEGEITCECLFDPADVPTPRVRSSISVTFADSAVASCDSAFITKYDPDAPVGDKMKANITWKLSGEVTWS